VLRHLKERCEKAIEKYISYFTVDCHQKIIRQGEIDMTSLLPPPQAPIVSTLDPSFEAFMEQRGELSKEHIDESIKNGHFHIRNLLP
jgi:N12 class adenine-specific DNA methylase